MAPPFMQIAPFQPAMPQINADTFAPVQNALMRYTQGMQQQQQRNALLQGLQGLDMSPGEREMMAANPQMAQGILGQVYQNRFDPMAKLKQQQMQADLDMSPLRRQGMEADIAAKRAEAGMYPLKRQGYELDLNSKRLEYQQRLQEMQSPKLGKESLKPGETVMFYDPRTGQVKQQFQNSDDGAKLTEGQTKDAFFAERLLRSEQDLSRVAPTNERGEFTKWSPTGARQRFGPDEPGITNLYMANFVNSREWQAYQRAAREGLASILRKDTGAAVTKQEFDLYFPMYYPQPGDSPQVIMDKTNARQRLAQGLRGASGPAYRKMYPDQAPAPQQTAPPDGGGVSFDTDAQIPEGARVRDNVTGQMMRKRNGQMVPE